ncbi:MAG: ATPase, T2SS/T4P/T4SS family [Gemmatimonadota bacterium]
MITSGRRLGDILVEAGAATRADVETAVQRGRELGQAMSRILQEQYGVEESEIYRALGKRYLIPFADIDNLLALLDPGFAQLLPERFRDFQRVMPIHRDGSTALVATCDPLFQLPDLTDTLRTERVELRLITPTDYERLRAMIELGQLEASSPAAISKELSVPGTSGDSLDWGTVTLFDAIILEAVAQRASDIHFEIYDDQPRIRVRVDGELRDLGYLHLTPFQFVAVVNVGKVRAHVDIAERRAPQGGRFSAEVRGHAFDVRAQTQPSLHGEHLVLRLLPQEAKPLEITTLGFSEPVATQYRRSLHNPGGLILVVGPTGSGKSTTLYAGLQLLAADPSRKVISVEDPIEYALHGVQQCQVLPEVGFTFASAMRAFVREDPDVILVGEIRDEETALEAIRASQTGHLVLSTLHCNDTVDAVQRMLDLGAHPNSIGSELLAIVAQRLARRICPGCRVEVEPDSALALEVFPDGAPKGFRTWKGTGCTRCGGHGTRGRIAVAEFLQVTSDFRLGISHHLPVDDLRAVARRGGMRPLRDEALTLVQSGIIEFGEMRDLLTTERLPGAVVPGVSASA